MKMKTIRPARGANHFWKFEMLIFDQLKRNDAPLRNLAVGVSAAFLLLLAGLWYVQILRSKRYVESEKDQAFRTVRIPATRGKILDRNGISLAENRASYNISLYLDELRKDFQQEYKHSAAQLNRKLAKPEREHLESQVRTLVAARTVQQLSGMMRQPLALDEKAFQRHYEIRRVLPFPVWQNLRPDQIARFQEQPANPRGVDLEVQPTRFYPFSFVGSHLLGQLTRDNSSAVDEDAFFNYRLQDFRGVRGLEGAFDQNLGGRPEIKAVTFNRLGYRRVETIWPPAEAGKNLVLTIDLPIQLAAENALRNSIFGTNTRGAVIVLNVKNGDILALASNPAPDPNKF